MAAIVHISAIIVLIVKMGDTDSYVWGGDSLVESAHQFVGHAPLPHMW